MRRNHHDDRPFISAARWRSSPAAMAASASAWREGLRTPAPTSRSSGRNEAKSTAAVAELRRRGAQGDLRRSPTSPTRPRSPRWSRASCANFGRIDILVNNAGINIRKPPQALVARRVGQRDRDQPHQRVPLLAGGLPGNEGGGGGKIINIGSMMSIFGASFAPAYAASKGGIVQFTRSCAVRLGRRQHPGQRGAAGLDRHRSDPTGPRADHGPA